MGNFIHYLSTFLAGLVVGFVSAWRLALLSIAVIPGIAFAGGLYAYTLTGLTSKSRESYANAGIIAEQVSIIRTKHDSTLNFLRTGAFWFIQLFNKDAWLSCCCFSLWITIPYILVILDLCLNLKMQ